MDSALSASDILALTKDNNDAFGGNGSWLIILILFLLGGGNGFFGGRNVNVATQEDVANGFTTSTMMANQREILGGQREMQNWMNQGFSGLNTEMLVGFNNIQRNMDHCCCDLKTAIHAEGEATRALIKDNTIQDLRDKVAYKDTLIAEANNRIVQNEQSRYILSQLGYYATNPAQPRYCGIPYPTSCGCSGTTFA